MSVAKGRSSGFNTLSNDRVPWFAVIALLLLSAITFNGYSDEFYYLDNGEKVYLQRIPNRYYLRTNAYVNFSETDWVKDVIWQPGNEGKGYDAAVISEIGQNELEKIESIVYVGHAYECEESYRDGEMYSTGSVRVGLKDFDDLPILEQMAKDSRIDMVGPLYETSAIYVMSSNKNSDGNVFQIANRLYETGMFDFAEPGFLSACGGGAGGGGGEINATVKTQNARHIAGLTIRQSAQTLHLNLPDRGNVSIYSLNGAKVRTFDLSGGSHALRLNSFPRGTYIVRANSGAWSRSARVLVK